MGSAVSLEQKQQWMRERNSPAAASCTLTTPTERHYSVAEVAAMWSLSDDAVRKIFEREPGVLVIGGAGGGRRYRTLRIPESVLQRVHRRLSNV